MVSNIIWSPFVIVRTATGVPAIYCSSEWLKNMLFSAESTVLFASDVICTFLLASKQLSTNVWKTWICLQRKFGIGNLGNNS